MTAREKCEALIPRWERRASRRFYDATQENDPVGKRLIEQGALVYLNCVNEVREAIASPSRGAR